MIYSKKRFAVFAASRKLLSIVLRDGRVKLDDLFEYRAAVSEAVFLFDEDVTSYPQRIDATVLSTIMLRDNREGVPPGEERSKNVAEETEALKWLVKPAPAPETTVRTLSPVRNMEKPVVVVD